MRFRVLLKLLGSAEAGVGRGCFCCFIARFSGIARFGGCGGVLRFSPFLGGERRFACMSAALEAAAFFWECAALFVRRLFAGGLQSLRGDLQEARIILGSAVFRCCCRLSIFGRLSAFESLERFGVPPTFCALAPFGFWGFGCSRRKCGCGS